MKRFFLVLAVIACSLIALNGCKKEEKTGNLFVICKDGSGTLLTAETVYLYSSQSNFDNRSYASTATTDATGTAKFYNLTPGSYWVDCDFVNKLDEIVTIDGVATVSAGYETTITIEP